MPSKGLPARRSVPKTALRIPKRERARRRRKLKRRYGLTRRDLGAIGSGGNGPLPPFRLRAYLAQVEHQMRQPHDPPPKPRAHPKFPVSTRRPKPKRRTR